MTKIHINLGPKQDHASAKDYILKKFLAENPDPDKSCYSHFTTATGKKIDIFISSHLKIFLIFRYWKH